MHEVGTIINLESTSGIRAQIREVHGWTGTDACLTQEPRPFSAALSQDYPHLNHPNI